ncbi:zinc-ribbon domain-containing protein [Candidatus Bathyarchaeota archaeon]|nr:zinc-ribbon domain-containing protein [Candidatus Bathyarchaeota archaeon]
MPYCAKCGTETSEGMTFCPKCGAPLKAERPPVEAAPARYRHEKQEKGEKQEKSEKAEKAEKGEKYEKREFGLIGPLIGGLFLIFLGFVFYLQLIGYNLWQNAGAFFLVIVGILIIIGAIMAARRHPRPRGTI